MRKIFITLSKKWPEYMLEILVITIGILGAFALNNWNENRLERNEEIEVLIRVKNDLQNTIDEMVFLNGIRDKVLGGSREILKMANQTNPDKRQLDSLLGLTMYRPTFNNKMGAVELLFSSGKINLIKSDSIKDRLITWPGSIDDTIEEEAYAMKLFQDHYYPKLAEYVYVNDLVGQALGISFFGGQILSDKFPAIQLSDNYERLLQDLEFLNHLRMRASHMQVSNSETLELIKQTEDIIRLIDESLDL